MHTSAHKFENDIHLLSSLSFPRVLPEVRKHQVEAIGLSRIVRLVPDLAESIHRFANLSTMGPMGMTAPAKGSHLRNLHPVCSMRAENFTAETSDCSIILRIGHSMHITETARPVPTLIGMSRNTKRLKLQKQPIISVSSSLKCTFLFDANYEGLLCIRLRFWFASALTRSMGRIFARSCSA